MEALSPEAREFDLVDEIGPNPSMPAPLPLSRQVEELTLIKCSLLPGERLTFLDRTSDWRGGSSPSRTPHSTSDNTSTSQSSGSYGLRSLDAEAEAAKWEKLVTNDLTLDDLLEDTGLLPARFRLAVDGAKITFDVDSEGYDGECRSVNDCIAINGDDLSRAMQELWRRKIKEGLDDIRNGSGGESEYPLYQLFSLYVLPLVHQLIDEESQEDPSSSLRDLQVTKPQLDGPDPVLYHVLFTSHHLVSSTKRRKLQSWSSDLRISGFAKVGYPGVIYAQGFKDDVEEFVENVKAMQWKALKVRFVELLVKRQAEEGAILTGWNEFERVGQVVEEMRRLGRGKCVLEMGIGGGAE